MLAGTPERWRALPARARRAGARRARRRPAARRARAPRCGSTAMLLEQQLLAPGVPHWQLGRRRRARAAGGASCATHGRRASTTSESVIGPAHPGPGHYGSFRRIVAISGRNLSHLPRPGEVAGFGGPVRPGQRSQGDTEMHSRTARGRIAGLIVFAVGAGSARRRRSAAVSPSPIVRPFTVRYAINTNGDIAHGLEHAADVPGGRGRDADAGRLRRRPGGRPPATTTTSTCSTSTSTATPPRSTPRARTSSVPAGATVLFAGLYWGAALDQGETLPLQCDAERRAPAQPAGNPAAAASALLQSPGGGGYVPVTASVFDTYTEDLGCPAGRRRRAHALPGASPT